MTKEPGEDALPRRPSWLQVNVSLFPGPRPDLPFIPWGPLAEQVHRWREAGYLRQFSFVRKPPGLRLRFGVPDGPGQLEPALVSWLWACERANAVRGFRFGHYEPERHRFGGGAGMAIAHDLFDRDSTLALRYECSGGASGEGEEQEGSTVRRQVLALSACHDLFRRCLDDGAEVWDVWKRLEIVVGPAGSAPSAIPGGSERARWVLAAASGAAVPFGDVENDILSHARHDNRHAAEALVAAVFAGRLTRGIRSWLTAATVFQWNRWGVGQDLADLSATVSAIAAQLEPDRAASRPDPGSGAGT